jgi:hypothetical protein
VVYRGDLGFVGDQPRDAHYLGVVAGVVAEAAANLVHQTAATRPTSATPAPRLLSPATTSSAD